MISNRIHYVGVNDNTKNLFEGLWPLPYGVSYNSYIIEDEKIALIDTVESGNEEEYLSGIRKAIGDRPIDYLVINHMEPDHGASLEEVLLRYPDVTIISTEKAFMLMRQFGFNVEGHSLEPVKEGDTKCFGSHTVTFIAAPMVHWPEAMVTFDTTNGVLFAADAFGSFGALDGKLFNDEVNFDRDWIDDARRYYTNIVGKYGPQVQALLKKAAGLDIAKICPLHGPVLTENLGYYINLYDIWSSYEVESDGIVIAYTSVYGNTKAAVELLAQKLKGILCHVNLIPVNEVKETGCKRSSRERIESYGNIRCENRI